MNNNSQGAIGFVGVLMIVFIALKLAGVIAWSWWWVLLPIWITALFVVVVVFLTVLIITIVRDK